MLRINKSAFEYLKSIEITEDGIVTLEWTLDEHGIPLPAGDSFVDKFRVTGRIQEVGGNAISDSLYV